MNAQEEKVKGSPLAGALIAFFSSLCCLLPLAAILLGFGSLPWLLKLTTYHPYFIAVSVVALAALLWFTYQRNISCCSTEKRKRQLYLTLGLIALAYGLTFSFTSLALPALLNKYTEPKKAVAKPNVKIARLTMVVKGLSCPSCTNTIRSLLMQKPGVKDAQVLYPSGVGYVVYDPLVIKKSEIVNIIASRGYKVETKN